MIGNSNNQVNHSIMSSQNFDYLQKVIEQGNNPNNKQNNSVTHSILDNVLELGISYIAKKQQQKFVQIAREFCGYLSENRHTYLHHEYLIQCFPDLKLLICRNNKVYQLGKPGVELKGFVLVGKAVSVFKRKKKQQQQFQFKDQRQQIHNLIEQGVIRLVQDGKYYLSKSEKNFQLQDIILRHDMPDSTVDQVFMGNQVFNSFVPIQKSIILIMPSKMLKPQCFNFIKSSLLHVYLDDACLLSKIMTKQLFYKNSILKGIYFIQQGQVEVRSGRIIARGWSIFGKCKTSGLGWKFKPIPFIRFLSKNINIWKQFFSDIQLNNQYPFNIVHILGLNDEDDFTSSAEWRSLGKKKIGGNKSPKLPKINIGSNSVDQSKYQQIQKMRHYDQRINDIFSYKQDLLTRKLKGVIQNKFQPIFRDEKSQKKLDRKKNLILYRMNSKGSAFSKKQLQVQTQPTQNILIMSVLKRLQSIADINQTSRSRQYSVTQQANHQFTLNHKAKRQNVKILPMQLHQRHKMLNKSKRY